jgi:hypothetical protein
VFHGSGGNISEENFPGWMNQIFPNVGGMNRSDQNISLVRTSIRGKKKQGRVIFVEIISRTKKNNKQRQYIIIFH